MVYLTGDIHADPSRLSSEDFPEQKEMTKDDYVIILGDFGLVWDYHGESKSERNWLDWLENKPFTTLFIDGNHENFDRLYSYPVEEWHGGKVHFIRSTVIHLMRGQVFNIEGKSFFTFGGARSHDISDGILELDDPELKEKVKRLSRDPFALFRINHGSWWKEELPSEEEMQEGFDNLQHHGNKVDYILTHCIYTALLRIMDKGHGLYKSDCLTEYLQKIKQTTDYKQWAFGHFHINQNFYWERATCFYDQITRIL